LLPVAHSWGAIDERAQHRVEFNTSLACVMLEREPTLVEAIQHPDSRHWVLHALRANGASQVLRGTMLALTLWFRRHAKLATISLGEMRRGPSRKHNGSVLLSF
jgi:hypothetical protein